MFDAERAFENWRARLSTEGRLSSEQITELESHVRDAIEDFTTDQLSAEEKFLVATQRLGHPQHLEREYEKVTPWMTWRVPMFWATAGVAWVLGVEAVLEIGVPFGALVAARVSLPLFWLEAWTFVVYVGGPMLAFGSVAAWMRRYTAGHPASKKALFATIAVAGLLRAGSIPIHRFLSSRAWRSFDVGAMRDLQTVWQLAAVTGLLFTVVVGAIVLVRFRAMQEHSAARYSGA